MCQSGKGKIFLLPVAALRVVGEGRRKGEKRESSAVVCLRYQRMLLLQQLLDLFLTA